MGLGMKEKQALTEAIARRYRRGSKKDKKAILDEFIKTTGYNRKYAIHLLGNWGKKQTRIIEGKPVRLVAGKGKRRKKRAGYVKYDEAVRKVLCTLWEFFDYMCNSIAHCVH